MRGKGLRVCTWQVGEDIEEEGNDDDTAQGNPVKPATLQHSSLQNSQNSHPLKTFIRKNIPSIQNSHLYETLIPTKLSSSQNSHPYKTLFPPKTPRRVTPQI